MDTVASHCLSGADCACIQPDGQTALSVCDLHADASRPFTLARHGNDFFRALAIAAFTSHRLAGPETANDCLACERLLVCRPTHTQRIPDARTQCAQR